jgi:hypothetical protein
MRGRAIGLGLLSLGAFLLIGALLTRLFLAPALVVLPLNQPAAPVAVGGPGTTYFDIGEQKQHTGDPVTVRQVIKGVQPPGNIGDHVAVWAFGETVTKSTGDVSKTNLITPPIEYTVCLDRRTAQAVHCSAEEIGTDKSKHIAGLTLNFPFGTKKQSYDVFDPTAGASFSAAFTGTTSIHGVAVYTFEQTIPETVVQTLPDVPGSMAGVPTEPSVTADVVYTNQRTFFVEPTSGVIVDIKEHPDLVFRGPDGTTGVTLLNGPFSGNEKTVADGVARAKKADSQIGLISTWLPLLLLVLGVVVLFAGVLMIWRRPAESDGATADPEVGSAADHSVAVP